MHSPEQLQETRFIASLSLGPEPASLMWVAPLSQATHACVKIIVVLLDKISLLQQPITSGLCGRGEFMSLSHPR